MGYFTVCSCIETIVICLPTSSQRVVGYSNREKKQKTNVSKTWGHVLVRHDPPPPQTAIAPLFYTWIKM